ncbi:unnamed protein product, partial [marine sediment metagenome]
IEWFDTGFDGEPERLVVEKLESDSGKLDWLHSLSNAVIKMGNDHDIGDHTKELLNRWLEEIDNL